MHEASLMKDLMRRIEREAAAQKALKVIRVSVWLGALSHMSEAHFADHFETAAAGSIAQDAKLDVILSNDLSHADAQEIRLISIEIDTG